MEKRFLPGYKISPDMVRTPSSLLETAGRAPGGIDRLREASLGYKSLDATTHAFVFPKLKPYAPGPGLDNMLFVAREGGTVGGIADLPPDQLAHLLDISDRVLSVYERAASPTDPLISEIVAINYHPQPLSEHVFNRKLHAQTLKDLHLHVIGFRASDIQELPSLTRTDLNREAFTELHDPILFIIDRMIALPGMQKQILYEVECLEVADNANKYSGIHLDAGNVSLNDPALSQDLLQLHANIEALYTRIANLFVDLEQADATGMPVLRPADERETRLRVFFEEIGFESPEQATRLLRAFLRMNSRLKSGTELLALSPEERSKFPIFLRGFAYTLALMKDPASGHVTLNLSPRLLSTGNLLATLGYAKVATEPPPSTWVQQKQQTEAILRDTMTPASLSDN